MLFLFLSEVELVPLLVKGSRDLVRSEGIWWERDLVRKVGEESWCGDLVR
jgi:hypothetical protein